MIGELLPALINHCLWSNQRQRESRMDGEGKIFITQREINNNGAVKEKWMLRVEFLFIFCISV